MTRAELKTRAKAQLGGGIFKENWLYAILVILIQGALVGAVNVIPGVGTVASIIIGGPITYGVAKLFLKQARDGQKMDIAGMFDGFKDDFGGTLLLGFLQSLFITLWSLLLIVPGIVKAYGYSMAFMLKNDHPDYDWRACLNESQKMMKGHKMELFILDLSFIGWLIVGELCLGVGTLWVVAYMQAAHTQFYENLRQTTVVG